MASRKRGLKTNTKPMLNPMEKREEKVKTWFIDNITLHTEKRDFKGIMVEMSDAQGGKFRNGTTAGFYISLKQLNGIIGLLQGALVVVEVPENQPIINAKSESTKGPEGAKAKR